MKIKITRPGIDGAKGAIPIGTELDVKEEPKGWAGRYEVISGGDTKAKTAVTNPAQNPVQQPTQGYAVKKGSPGWFVVVDSDGNEVTKSLREDDLKGFDDLSDEDKAAFAELHKPTD